MDGSSAPNCSIIDECFSVQVTIGSMKKRMFARLTGIAACFVVFSVGLSAQTKSATPLDAFWTNLRALCGKAFEGAIVEDTSNSPDFAGKRLVMHVRSCEGNRIRIPFFVGDDRSRTWVLTRKGDRLELKHDHRKPDGKPDSVTMYGGTSTNPGEAIRQFFPADEQTTRVVALPEGDAPSAAANIWWFEHIPGQHFIYNLRRLGRGRLFSVKFDITKEVEAPPAPWGWADGP